MAKRDKVKLTLESENSPSFHQSKAIEQITANFKDNIPNQVLLGITGSGKTYTIANIIQNLQRPVIVLSHNKTLAGQLYSEFKSFFPNNNVEYFISYFDYYRPEAYMPSTDTFIDKTSKTNWDIEAMRLSAENALLTKRDTIVVASVAAIYGALNPEEYKIMIATFEVGQKITRKEIMQSLVQRAYERNDVSTDPSTFRVRGEIIDIFPSWTSEIAFRIETFGDEIESITKVDPFTMVVTENLQKAVIFPGTAYATHQERINEAVKKIEAELELRIAHFKKEGKLLEAQRIEQRVRHDIEALSEFGMVSGIENYARYLDNRDEGERPYTLFDYLPKDGIIILDESHMMIPQINGMYNGDRSRKENLVNYGFRLPSALDNRPLRIDEFEALDFQRLFVSATPSQYELDKSGGLVSEIITRPTGLLDPVIEVVPTENQIEDIINRIKEKIKKKERTLVLTITIRMAEELTLFLQEKKIKVSYLHNELKTFERAEILRKLRLGIFDVVVGINLLREGIDLPEVSSILVLDADKESFFRSKTSLIQIAGRAARNQNGKVIFYGDKITKSMEECIRITKERREFQIKYNQENEIEPKTIIKDIPEPLNMGAWDESIVTGIRKGKKASKKQREALIEDLRSQMKKAAKELNFERAAQLRDIILELESQE